MTESEQRASAVAAAFVSHGCSIARVAGDEGLPTFLVGKCGHNLVVLVSPTGQPETEGQRKWADRWHGQVVWCNGRAHADAISVALRDGEFC